MKKQLLLQIEVEDTPVYFRDLERSDTAILKLTYDFWVDGVVSDLELIELYSFHKDDWEELSPTNLVHKIYLSVVDTAQPKSTDAVLSPKHRK